MLNFHDTIVAIQAVFSKSWLKSVLSNFTALGGFFNGCSQLRSGIKLKLRLIIEGLIFSNKIKLLND
jgi:hypothetical protein